MSSGHSWRSQRVRGVRSVGASWAGGTGIFRRRRCRGRRDVHRGQPTCRRFLDVLYGMVCTQTATWHTGVRCVRGNVSRHMRPRVCVPHPVPNSRSRGRGRDALCRWGCVPVCRVPVHVRTSLFISCHLGWWDGGTRNMCPRLRNEDTCTFSRCRRKLHTTTQQLSGGSSDSCTPVCACTVRVVKCRSFDKSTTADISHL